MSSDYLNLMPKIKSIYDNGGNIIEYLKKRQNRNSNSIQDILISYDFQSGTYIDQVEKNPKYTQNYTEELASIINCLGSFNSILEVGVGEATTLGNLIQKLSKVNLDIYGFDISWSRVHCANQYLKRKSINSNLFVADLFNIPLQDNAIDIVYTSHSLEPNGGKERQAIEELYRVANRFLVLLEPTYEFANDDGKKRMERNGYVRNLKETILNLGLDLVEYRPYKYNINQLNPTGLYIIKKKQSNESDFYIDFYCPISKSNLKEYKDHFFSSQALVSFPKIMDIPCLCEFYGVLTTKHEYKI